MTEYTTREFLDVYGNVNNTIDYREGITRIVVDNNFKVTAYKNEKIFKVFTMAQRPRAKTWVKHGKCTYYLNTSSYDSVVYYFNMGKLHRVDKPARITNWADKHISLCYFNKNKRHRDDGPASITTDPNGKLHEEMYFINNKLHRDGEPANIIWEDGQIAETYWYHHGKRHRDGGPASIILKDGQIIETEWYHHCKKYKPLLTKRAVSI